jgi:hypothetical protein
MKTHTMKFGAYAAMLLLAVFTRFTVSAQEQPPGTEPCKTDRLIINTGYDPITNTVLGAGVADPNWFVAGVAPDLNPVNTTLGFTPTPGAAIVAAGLGAASDPASRWISFYNPGGPWYQTLNVGNFGIRLTRTFTVLCEPADVDVNLRFARDNYVTNFRVLDPTSAPIATIWPNDAVVNQPLFYNNWQVASASFTALPPGVYTIEVTVHNFHVAGFANPHGINIVGTVNAPAGNLLAPGHDDCDCDCSDKCYWKVQGNNILNGNNKLGTNSQHDVVMRTSGVDKGIWTSGNSSDPNDDGRLGWQTLNPTAHLHINCAGGNPEDGGSGSDVRFEQLERGWGNILVIDDQGYVYNSGVKLNADGGIKGMMAMKMAQEHEANQIKVLEGELAELKAQLQELKAQRGVIAPESDKSSLYQNVPNPFGKETTIPYFVKSISSSASISVKDMAGREIGRYVIREAGYGQVQVNSDQMTPGAYTYSLIIDGKEVDTKRMILTK